MRLHIGVGGAEQLLRPIDCQLLGDIDEIAAAVIALARIALGVLVGENRALSFQHARAGVVLRRDQLDMIFLAVAFVRDRLGELGIEAGNRHLGSKHELRPPSVSR
jgi:hypothetical protein